MKEKKTSVTKEDKRARIIPVLLGICLLVGIVLLVLSTAKKAGNKDVLLKAKEFLDSCEQRRRYDAHDYSNPINLSEVEQAFDLYMNSQEDEQDSLLSLFFTANMPNMYYVDSLDRVNIIISLFDNDDFSLKVPEYADSKQPFLAYAEDCYNGLVWGWDVWSNFEVWYRGNTADLLCENEEVERAIKDLNTDMIHDAELRQLAQKCCEDLLALMKIPVDDWPEETSAMEDYLIPYIDTVASKAYKYVSNKEEIGSSFESINNMFEKAVSDKYERYLNATDEKQLKVILDGLISCRNFDEQCTLWRLWADCKKSIVEDEWIIVVGERLLNSGYYNPSLFRIWLSWRALCQLYHYGASRDSSIPNFYYNEVRKKCYQTCLKRIAQHPDDVIAMNCAFCFASIRNLDRYGLSEYGNNAIGEVVKMLPNRK